MMNFGDVIAFRGRQFDCISIIPPGYGPDRRSKAFQTLALSWGGGAPAWKPIRHLTSKVL